ncbi:MAG: ATP-binding protein, partial [Bacteroidota bacterium]
DMPKAEKCFRQGLAISEELNTLFVSTVLYNSMADIFLQKGKRDSSIYFAQRSLEFAQKNKYKLFEIGASGFLAYNVFDGINSDSALKYMKIMFAANNETFNSGIGQQFQKVRSEAEKKEKDLANAKKEFQNKIRIYLFILALAFLLVTAIIFWRNNRHKREANLILVRQKEKLEATLEELKAAQKQLIQTEKMASLGELTAGIAHEIQNPLNFVNNFSEVSREMLDEMRAELDKDNKNEAKTIYENVKENLDKILHHGKRAEAIVKGMLQHSRTNNGQKELTDINVLADEYIRLSYHGLRARDKSFNVKFETDFDSSIGKIAIIPQDIGRVILNLVSNAIYAASVKASATRGIGSQLSNGSPPHPGKEIDPTVWVSTKKMGGKLILSVRDNGNGIPGKILDKIFQPFFTTKPPGQGTGLWLSLSYDIVKAHGGEITVNTKEGEGTEFVISLPRQSGK